MDLDLDLDSRSRSRSIVDRLPALIRLSASAYRCSTCSLPPQFKFWIRTGRHTEITVSARVGSDLTVGHGVKWFNNLGAASFSAVHFCTAFWCFVPKRYILQLKCLKKWIGSAPARNTTVYNFQPLHWPWAPQCTALQTDGQTDRCQYDANSRSIG